MGTLANSEDTDIMQHNAALFAKIKQSSGDRNTS